MLTPTIWWWVNLRSAGRRRPIVMLMMWMCCLCGGGISFAQSYGPFEDGPVTRRLVVNGVERMALVFPGRHALNAPSPLIFAFHGFSGSSRSMSTTRLHVAWPEATVVYPEGIRVHSRRFGYDVPAWQSAPGRDNDRDVRFIDQLLVDLHTSYQIDDRRVYVAGVSNGAIFAYVLLTMRPQSFAAFGIVAGAAGFTRLATVPRAVLIIQGKHDQTIRPQWAVETRDLLRQLNGCGMDEQEWAPGYISYQPCASGCPIIWHLHDGGHDWPHDATGKIVKFFQGQALPGKNIP